MYKRRFCVSVIYSIKFSIHTLFAGVTSATGPRFTGNPTDLCNKTNIKLETHRKRPASFPKLFLPLITSAHAEGKTETVTPVLTWIRYSDHCGRRYSTLLWCTWYLPYAHQSSDGTQTSQQTARFWLQSVQISHRAMLSLRRICAVTRTLVPPSSTSTGAETFRRQTLSSFIVPSRKSPGNRYNVPPSAEFVARVSGIPTMAKLPYQETADGLDAAFVGVPIDTGTSNRPGARSGCTVIRVLIDYCCPVEAVNAPVMAE